MFSFLSKRRIVAKLVYLTFMFSLLCIGVYLFIIQKDVFFNYKPYYFKSYLSAKAIGFKYGNSKADLSGQNAKSVPVLLYHGIVPKDDGENITPVDFQNQMIALKKDGYQTITLDDFYQFEQGKKQLPAKSFLLTFDDGRKDSYYPGDPVLKALNYNAVMFAIAGRPEDDKFHLSTKEYQSMLKSGRWEIASHGYEDHGLFKIDASGKMGHFLTNRLWLDTEGRLETDTEFQTRVENDLTVSKKIIEEKLGNKVEAFAFPFGDYKQIDSEVPVKLQPILLSTVKKIYPMSFYQAWAGGGSLNNYPDKDLFIMKRIEPQPGWTPDDLINTLKSTEAKDLPYQNSFSNSDGWVNTWGKSELSSNGLAMSADKTDGAAVYLDGSYWWTNYVYRASVNWAQGSNLTLQGRYQDSSNYLDVAFSGGKVQIEEIIDGKNTMLAEAEDASIPAGGNVEIGLKVNGSQIDAILGSKIIATAQISSGSLINGGVGLIIWDQNQNNAKVVIKTVSVKQTPLN